jgi:hypothetical protein
MLDKNKNMNIPHREASVAAQGANAFAQKGILLQELRSILNGRVITPDNAGYDEARTLFYGGMDRRPAAIVRPADANDVTRVVTLARIQD